MGFAKPSVIMDRLKQKVATPIAEKTKAAIEGYQKKGLTARFIDGVVKGSTASMRPAGNIAGQLARGAAVNFAQGHWNESGLSNIFGPLPIGKRGKKLKRILNQSRNSVTPQSGIGSNDATRIISAIRSSMSNMSQSLDGIDGSMAGLRDDIQKLTDVNRRGFLALIRSFNSNAPNPFAGMSANRRARPKPVVAQSPGPKPSALGSAGGLLSTLFGKNGLIASALSGILGTAKNLMGVVGSLMGATAALSKLGSSLARPLGRGLAALAGGAAIALGKGGKAIARGIGQSVTKAIGGRPKASPATVEALKGTAESKAKPGTPAKASIDPKAKPGTPVVDGPDKKPIDKNRPLHDPEKPKVNNHAKAEQVLGETKAKLDPAKPAGTPMKPAETPKPQSAPETPKPAPEAPKANAEASKQAVKQGTKIGTGALSRALIKVGIPIAALGIEAWEGYNEWSEAYDQFADGKLSTDEYREIQNKIVARHTGAFAGSLAGGAIGGLGGSLFGPVGTFVGGIGGAMIGGYYGSKAGESLSGTVLNEVITDTLAGRTKAQPNVQPQSSIDAPTKPEFTIRTTEKSNTPEGIKMSVTERPATAKETERLIAMSERRAERANNQTPVIISAPQTTNNNTTSGGGSGGSRHAPGSATPTFSGLDFQATGMGIPGLPGAGNF